MMTPDGLMACDNCESVATPSIVNFLSISDLSPFTGAVEVLYLCRVNSCDVRTRDGAGLQAYLNRQAQNPEVS